MIPVTTLIGGLPFQLVNEDMKLEAKGHSCNSNLDNLNISVRTTYPEIRRASYYFNEVAYQLLTMAGMDDKAVEAFKHNFGAILFKLVLDNDFSWLRNPDDGIYCIPSSVKVDCIPYTVKLDQDDYLEASGLLGEIPYSSLEIKVKDGIAAAVKPWIFIHEVTHALLYEGNYAGDHNAESLVQPLGSLLYIFLRDNDFSKIKVPTEE